MEFSEISRKALAVRAKYSELEKKKYGREWTREEIFQSFVGDVGDLSKLVMSKADIRGESDVEDKLAHELSDCLWSIIVLADKYHIDIEKRFIETMTELEEKTFQSK